MKRPRTFDRGGLAVAGLCEAGAGVTAPVIAPGYSSICRQARHPAFAASGFRATTTPSQMISATSGYANWRALVAPLLPPDRPGADVG